VKGIRDSRAQVVSNAFLLIVKDPFVRQSFGDFSADFLLLSGYLFREDGGRHLERGVDSRVAVFPRHAVDFGDELAVVQEVGPNSWPPGFELLQRCTHPKSFIVN